MENEPVCRASGSHDCSASDWAEEYYGLRCRACGLFIPYGCEPWAPDDDDDDTEACHHGVSFNEYCVDCEIEDHEDFIEL